MTTRPFFKMSGAEVIEGIEAGVQAAIDEAAFRNSPKVRAAVKVHEAKVAAATTKPAKKAPRITPKAAKVATDEAKAMTAKRNAAWAWRNAEFHAGRKVTVNEAYAKFGAVRANA